MYKNNGFGDWVRSILAEVHNLISCGGNPFRTRCRTPRTALQTNKFPPTATGKGHIAFLKAPGRDKEGEVVHAVWMRRFDPRRTNAEGDGVATVHTPTPTDRQSSKNTFLSLYTRVLRQLAYVPAVCSVAARCASLYFPRHPASCSVSRKCFIKLRDNNHLIMITFRVPQQRHEQGTEFRCISK